VIDGLATGQQISAFDVKMQVADGVDLIGFTGTSTPPPAPTAGNAPAVPTSGPTGPAVTGGANTSPSTRSPLAGQLSADDSVCKTVVKTWDSTTRVARVSQLCTGTALLSTVSVPITLKGTKNATGKIAVT